MSKKTKNLSQQKNCWDRNKNKSCGATRLAVKITATQRVQKIHRLLFTESHAPSHILRQNLCPFRSTSEVHSATSPLPRSHRPRLAVRFDQYSLLTLLQRFNYLYHTFFWLSSTFLKKFITGLQENSVHLRCLKTVRLSIRPVILVSRGGFLCFANKFM